MPMDFEAKISCMQLVEKLHWPFDARTRYMRLAMEKWDLVKESIQWAIHECENDEGQLADEHFQFFYETEQNSLVENCHLTKYGCMLTEKYLYRMADLDGIKPLETEN